MRSNLLSVIQETLGAIDGSNSDLSKIEPDTKLFGEGGCLDSIALVSAIIAIEQAIEEHFGRVLVLASDRAMSRRHSPFASAAILADYIDAELNAEVTHG